MPTLYARQTPLPDLRGRLDYISNDSRQEHLLAVYDNAEPQLDGYWSHLAEEAQAAFRMYHGEEDGVCCEAREIYGWLPNSLIDRMAPEEICRALAGSFTDYTGQHCRVALQFNETESNLHFHLIYSPRELLEEPLVKVAERNLFFDEYGKRRYKKKDILDEDGQLRDGCYIVPKGQIYEQHYFGSVDEAYSQDAWLDDVKAEWLLPLLNGELHGDEPYELFDHSTGKLTQQHIGKGSGEEYESRKAATIEYNNLVKGYNRMIDRGQISPEEAVEIHDRVLLAPDRLMQLRTCLDELMIEDEHKRAGIAELYELPEPERSTPDSDRELKVRRLRELYREARSCRLQRDGDPMDFPAKAAALERLPGIEDEIAQLRADLNLDGNRQISVTEQRKAIEWAKLRREKNDAKAEDELRRVEEMMKQRYNHRKEPYRKEEFKDLFYLVRQAEYLASSLRTEDEKLCRMMSRWEAYLDPEISEKERRSHAGYIRWCGCDPDSALELQELRLMREKILLQQEHAAAMKEALLDEVDSWKGQNSVYYAKKELAWLKQRKKQVKMTKKSLDKRSMELSTIAGRCEDAARRADAETRSHIYKAEDFCRSDKWETVDRIRDAIATVNTRLWKIREELKELKEREAAAKKKLAEAKKAAREQRRHVDRGSR